MASERPLHIPVILGTARKGRASAHAATFLVEQIKKRQGVVTELIDLAQLPMPVNDAGEAIKDLGFSAKINAADAIVVVAPEYNHSFPGLLKHVLDSCLKEYIHKAVGVAGVSAGPFGGTRVIENFLPVFRELGLVAIFWDVNFGNVSKVFDQSGQLLDQAFLRRTDKFLKELEVVSKMVLWQREEKKEACEEKRLRETEEDLAI